MSAPRPSEADVEGLAMHLYDATGFHAADSWATETSINRGRYEALAEAVLASDWLAARDAEHEREVAALRRWKDEALPVLLGLQDLGRALNIPLGTRITGEVAAEAAAAMTDRAEAAERALADRDAAIKALADVYDRRHAESDCVCRDYDDPSTWCDNPLRALLPRDDAAGAGGAL